MYDDHSWYTATPDPPERLRQQDVRRTESPARPSPERTSSNTPKKPQPRKLPELSTPDVPKRAKSIHDLRASSEKNTAAPESGKAVKLSLRRSKSRSDLEELKQQKYGQGKGLRRITDLSQVEDELDFADWYGEFEEKMEDASNDEYKLFHSILESHLITCDNLLAKTDETLGILNGLKRSFAAIDEQTSAFEQSCESLVSQQARLQSLADSVAVNLQPFTELEPITRILARPGSDFVKTTTFRDMLFRLDRCLEWMNDPAHRAFPDVETYAPKFRHCMTRALTLVRNYFVSSMREVSDEVMAKIKEKNLTDNAPSALLYAKFRVNAPLLRDLVGEIESRCAHEEYISLLNECFHSYASIRQKLLLPMLSKRLTDLANASTSKDLVSFARSAISYTKGICMDEFDLFFAYFSGEAGESEIYNFLETICEPLYDQLRPRIMHELNLVKLCELCSLLQTRYMQDLDDGEPEPYDRTQLDFGNLIRPILQDTQSRVVFRAQSVIRTDIEHFVPTPQDLDYPANCRRTAASKPPRDQPPAPVVAATTPASDVFDTEALFAGWYPTLRKCIWLLSKIYRLVNSSVFDDLAHTIVHATVHSLLAASARLRAPADAHLFLLRHLLQLKSQLIAFDIEFAGQPDVEISFGASLEALRRNPFSLSNIIRLIRDATMPKVVMSLPDAKQELDLRLRTVIEEFTGYWTRRMTECITGPSNRIASADAPDPALNVRRAVEREVPGLREKVGEYVDDTRTGETLVAAVMESVVGKYAEYYDAVKGSVRGKGWGKEEFEKWCEGVFKVELGEEDGDVDSLQGDSGDFMDASVH